MPIPKLLGISLAECKRLLGNIVESYSVQGRTEEFEFFWEGKQITVVPVQNKILSVGIYQKTPIDDPCALFEAISESGGWTQDFARRIEVTSQFPGYAPDHPNHSFFESADLKFYGFSTKFTLFGDWPYRIRVVTSDFQKRLGELPSKYDEIKRPPTQPFFFFHNRRFEAQIGHPGEFDHFFGHSDGLTIQKRPRRAPLHQLVNLDLRDPALGLEIPGLSRLPLLYCFRFETGRLEYDLLADDQIRITHLDEDGFVEDWPYENYPERFLKLPFSISNPCASTLEDFSPDVWQGIRRADEKDKFICIVPSSPLYGVHLWHEDNNCDDIHVKCFVDPKERHVIVYNECD